MLILTHSVGYFHKMQKRILHDIIKTHLKKTKKSILLLGPRQVGKSTLIESLNPDFKINLAEEKVYQDHLKDPDLIHRQVLALPSGLIFIDEIQRIPTLLNTIQALIDKHKQYIFILTGSSARKLKRGQANLLPGRIFTFFMYPLTYWELGAKFHLDHALHVGALPEIYLQDYGDDLLKDYVGSYVREEIQTEALVRRVGSFHRFLDMAATHSGHMVNYTQISSDSEIPKESLRRYYDILEDTLLIHRLPGYTSIKGSRKALQREKILFFDLGVRHAILGQQNNKFSHAEQGHLFEQWLILQMIAWNSYHRKNWKLFYYRDDLKNEVDLIIETPQKIIALEIKSSKKMRKDFFTSLKVFASYVRKPVQSFVIFQGSAKEKWEDGWAIPYQDFLEHIETYCG